MGVQIKKTETTPAKKGLAALEAVAAGAPVIVTYDPPKKSELAAVIAQIRKDKGDKSIVKGSEIPNVERIPTGMFEFDMATGGGFPRGRYSIIYGPESSGKTNACYCAVANAQRLPPPCNEVVWVDLENTFDPNYAMLFGIDVDKLHVVKPGYGEEAVDFVDALVRADDVALLVVDSLAVIVSSKEIDQSVEKFDVGTAATLVKRLCNKVTIGLSQEAKRGHDPAVIFINQTRFKIGVMFGDPETMPGGQTMKFLSSLTVRIYGKNKAVKEYSPDVPVLKETVAVIKKAKVPVLRTEFKYDMAVVAHGDLGVGETDSWNAVKNELQSAGLLVKEKNGWGLMGVTYPTQKVIEDTYYAEKSFALTLQNLVLSQYKGQAFLHDDGSAKQ